MQNEGLNGKGTPHTPAPRDVACGKGRTGMENGVQHANAKLILPDGTEVELPLLQVSGMLSMHKLLLQVLRC